MAEGVQHTVPRGRGRPRVPLERIVAAALAIVDDGGPQALTMRALANRLSTGLAVLYRAVSGRAELVGLVVDDVLGRADFEVLEGIAQTGETKEWEDICRSAALSLYDSLAAHPGVAALLTEYIPTGPNALAVREGVLRLLLNVGFTPAEAARAYATVSRMVIGFAAQLHAESGTDPLLTQGFFAGLDPLVFPATRSASEVLARMRLDDEFRYALDLFLAGLSAERSR
ncbi:MAG TPA: TetR/AcrR family transcriptional regulator C-terminal domain-containing protein [Microbacterium sp.]|uniref:TetR/AcrR family transcriptional regulator n=1 Tax=Microbacterium sp. TaxID=51671 RepID=UPI002B52AA05|nr:TetR/AcrR family transcriptional regulator C-terminal domain-containing protein [Microbacterium sp.]HWI30897.1 TetR/AcrR family transcriptional regulator C-terminal domain-containing protein [Microbacterium sp.]